MLESQEEMGKIERFEEIEAWKEACSLAEIIYKITKLERFSKNYGLKEQIQRASVSIASNIAEGFERQTKKEFIYFLYIAKGSAGEVIYSILKKILQHITCQHSNIQTL